MEDDEKKNGQEQNNLAQNASRQAQNNMRNMAKKELNKKAKKEVTKNVAKGAAKKSMLAALGPVIAYGAIIILAIIVIVGVVVFLMTMPGMVMAQLKKLAYNIGSGIANYFGSDETYQKVDDNEINILLDYLEEMGYDLKGDGFLTNYKTAGDLDGGDYLDEEQGVTRYSEDTEVTISGETQTRPEESIKKAESEFLFMYTVSDNYVYTVKNFNMTTYNSGDPWYKQVFGTLQAAFGRIADHSIIGFFHSFAEDWGKGMIALYHEKGGNVGLEGDFYEDTWFGLGDNISLDYDKRLLKIKRGLFGKTYEYKLEGWTGRYGVPMDFLLAVHSGTMMPDLAFDLATSFPTEVRILLHKKNEDDDQYLPYISKVVNHWYRDVYFVKEDKPFIQTDEEYEDLMKERWTLYETHNSGKLNGEYKLYAIAPTGEYATDPSQIRNYDKANGKFKVENGLYLFEGTIDEAQELDLAVTKKAIAVDFSDQEYEDIGWTNENKGGIWVAYEVDGGKVKQVGEGMRTETNPLIKQMFLYNTYFRYDGTDSAAEAITKLRNENNLPYGALDRTYDLSNGYEVLENQTTEVQLDGGGTKTYSMKDVSTKLGREVLNQDSTNIFSMMENTHTIDADYIYKDFKELVVELGYFTKEELTDETPRLLAWVIPDVGSYGFPKRFLDKKENDFGTLSHSRQEYKVYDKTIGNKSGTIEGQTEGYRLPPATSSDASDEWELVDGTYAPGGTNFASTMGGNPGYYICNLEYEGITYEVWQDATSMCTRYAFAFLASVYDCNDLTFSAIVDHDHGIPIDNGVQENGIGGDVWKEHANITGTYYNYGSASMDVESMVTSIMEALESGIPVYFYSGYGSSAGRHAVDLLGILDNGKILMYNPAGTAASAYNIKNGVGNMYEYGDSGDAEENIRTLVSGTSPSVSGGSTWVIGYFIPDESPSGKKKKQGPKPYVGYEGNEAVVSPVTGILLDYGTYDNTSVDEKDERTNVDIKNGVHLVGSEENIALESETPVVDKVGYAKILVLDAKNYRKLEQYTGSNWADENNSLVNKNYTTGTARRILDDPTLTCIEDLTDDGKWDALNKMVYGYKEFVEKYEEGGIAGNIVYIDGFMCKDVDKTVDDVETQIPAGDDITIDSFDNTELEDKTSWRPSSYKKSDEYKAIQKSVTERIKVEEKLKDEAPSSYTLNANGQKLIFIKEGTVLGRTMTDKELLEAPYLRNGQFGTYESIRKADEGKTDDEETSDRVIGNYLRIIFRDKEDTVIENVEDYMKLDEYTGDDLANIGKIEEFMYWQAKEPEGFEYVLNGQQSYALVESGGRSRRDNPSDKYGHDYGIDNGGADDDNLCPGMWMDPGSSGRPIFEKVTGQTPVRYETFATGEQLLDIYTQELEVNMEEVRKEYPITESLDDEDTRMFALMDVMYAGGNNFKIGTIDDKLLAGDLDLTREDFLSNCTNENPFYRQNANGFTRRRLHDFYMYTEGYYCHDIYDTQGTEITQRWEFNSDTPFQDLMMDEEGAELVDL